MTHQITDNFKKHTTDSSFVHLHFLQKYLVNRFLQKVVDVVRPLPVKTILDVGAGEGFTLSRLEKEGIGKTREGVEPLQAARDLGRIHHPTVSLHDGSIYSLPYPDKSWDLVMCTEVLEHLEDPKKAVEELFRVSKKYVLLSVPNEPWFMLGNFLRGKNVTRLGNDIEHIHHWSGSEFIQFLEKYSHDIRYTAYYPLPWTIVLAEK